MGLALLEEESMKKLTAEVLIGAAVAAAVLLAGCATMSKGSTDADVAAIKEIWKTYSSARVAGDAALWLSLWDKEGIQMPPDIPARGKSVLDEVIPKGFAAGGVASMNIYPEEITVAGQWAYTRGTYDSDRVVGANTVRVDGKFLTILKRQPDGSWKIYRDCFNSNVPAK
jgi:ketosteroid isomerase-like protein